MNNAKQKMIHYSSASSFIDHSSTKRMSTRFANVFKCIEIDLGDDNQSELHIQSSSDNGWWFSCIEGQGNAIINAGRQASVFTNHALLVLSLRGQNETLRRKSTLPVTGQIALSSWEGADAVVSSGDFCYLCVYIPRDQLESLGGNEIPYNRSISIDHGPGAVLGASMRSLVMEMVGGVGNQSLSALFPSFANMAMTTLQQNLVVGGEKMNTTRRMARILEYLRLNHTNAELTPEQVAQKLGMSRRQLCREFERIGETYSTHLRQLRLERAKQQLIIQPDTPITQVACDFGFSSSTVFGRMFKDAYGMTPRDYARVRLS